MTVLAQLLVLVVALLHLGFLVLEMFLWNHPMGRKVFGLTHEFAAQSAALAKNQGLYNGFLAAGLLWGLWSARVDVQLYFLGCVVVAGVYGAVTVKRSILFVQALPGVLAIAAVLLAHGPKA